LFSLFNAVDAAAATWDAPKGTRMSFALHTYYTSRTIGTDQQSNPGDVHRLRRALKRTGHGRFPGQGAPNVTHGLRKAIKSFQRDFGLKADAIVRPGGPTERALAMALHVRGHHGETALRELRDTFVKRTAAGLAFRPHPEDRNAGLWEASDGRMLSDEEAGAFATRADAMHQTRQFKAALSYGMRAADEHSPAPQTSPQETEPAAPAKPETPGEPKKPEKPNAPENPNRRECEEIQIGIRALTLELFALRREEQEPLRKRVRALEEERDTLRKGEEPGQPSPVDRAPELSKRRSPKSPKGIVWEVFKEAVPHASEALDVYDLDTRMRIIEIERQLADLRERMKKVNLKEEALNKEIAGLSHDYEACVAQGGRGNE
jgi:peptidoglycan hydrolase-like protein with peptidoglycan-binding domain